MPGQGPPACFPTGKQYQETARRDRSSLGAGVVCQDHKGDFILGSGEGAQAPSVSIGSRVRLFTHETASSLGVEVE